jgi:hypothetical protein
MGWPSRGPGSRFGAYSQFRTIASLYRQTAAFRPGQSWSLLGQAKDWEYRALAELESYFKGAAQQTSAQLEIAIAA